MSIIKIRVVDQTLTITNAPMIAAGDINTDFVIFTFDSAWNGFGKTAVFFRDDNKEDVYEQTIDAQGKAIVPHEVTKTDGKIWVGVVGVNGGNVLTSEVIWYEIVNGVYTASLASATPWANAYEQMLTIAQQLQVDQEAFEESVETRINNLVIANTTNASGFEIETQTKAFDEQGTSLTLTATFTIPKDATILEASYKTMQGAGNNPVYTDNITVNITYHDQDTDNAIVTAKGVNSGGETVIKIVYAYSKAINLAELTDIRLGADGRTYESAGDAVRQQIDTLSQELENLTADQINYQSQEAQTAPKNVMEALNEIFSRLSALEGNS